MPNTKPKGRIIPGPHDDKPYTWRVLNPTHEIHPGDHPKQNLLELAGSMESIKTAVHTALQVSSNGEEPGDRQSGPPYLTANDYSVYRGTLERTGDAFSNANADFSRISLQIDKLQEDLRYYKGKCEKFGLLTNKPKG